MLALFLESKDEKLPNESSACPFRKPKPKLGFYFLCAWKSIRYCFAGALHQMSFVCLNSPSLQFFLASLGEPHSTETLWFWSVFSFLAIIKCFRTNLSPCQEMPFTLELETP